MYWSLLQRCAESKEMREMASRICRDYLHGAWKQISSRDIVLKRIRYVTRKLTNFSWCTEKWINYLIQFSVVVWATGCTMSRSLVVSKPLVEMNHRKFFFGCMERSMEENKVLKVLSQNLSYLLCCPKGGWDLAFMVFSLVDELRNTFL